LRFESDPVAPLGRYAATKLEGENRVLDATDGQALVVRTSWVFGPDRPAVPETIIERAQRADSVDAVADKFSAPTFSLDFAAHIEPFFVDSGLAVVGGRLNLCNTGSTSWHGYAQATLDLASEFGVPLRCRSVTPGALANMSGFRVPRPVHTAMAVEKFTTLTGITPRPWEEALREYIGTFFAAREPDDAT
jgi:dTDP-4-dehydrorhamnose reductase